MSLNLIKIMQRRSKLCMKDNSDNKNFRNVNKKYGKLQKYPCILA